MTSNIFAVLVVIAALPFAIAASLVTWMFRLKTKRSPAEVATYLRNFLDNVIAGEWDWDEFTSLPIADPQLDDIRRRASAIYPPIHDEDVATLTGLLAEAERLSAKEPSET